MKKVVLIALALLPMLNVFAQMEKSERYQRGWNKLQEIDGEAGERVVNGLQGISPELSRFILEYSFGDVYSLTSLDNKEKEIVAISSLIAQRAIPEMNVHFNGALNTGNTINEIKEVILQMSGYVGFPKSICAMNTFKEVLDERKSQGIVDVEGIGRTDKESFDRLKRGSETLALLDKNQEQVLHDLFDEFSPELIQYVLEYGYGDIYQQDYLGSKTRQIATIGALATLGTAPSQLKFHIKAGLNVGLTESEIKEIMLLMTVYSGFPSAINGLNILKEVIEESKLL